MSQFQQRKHRSVHKQEEKNPENKEMGFPVQKKLERKYGALKNSYLLFIAHWDLNKNHGEEATLS